MVIMHMRGRRKLNADLIDNALHVQLLLVA